jgi:hypothetical protein
MTWRRGAWRLWAVASIVWIAAATWAQWDALGSAVDTLSFDLGPRPELGDEARDLLARDCSDLPRALDRAACELDQDDVRRAQRLWQAAVAELAALRAAAWRTLAGHAALALGPPLAALTAWLAAAWVIRGFARPR